MRRAIGLARTDGRTLVSRIASETSDLFVPKNGTHYPFLTNSAEGLPLFFAFIDEKKKRAKKFKKPLDKENELCYNEQVAARVVTKRSLKIEQQERSMKQKIHMNV